MRIRFKQLILLGMTVISLVLSLFIYFAQIRRISFIEEDMSALENLDVSILTTLNESQKLFQTNDLTEYLSCLDQFYDNMKKHYSHISHLKYLPSVNYDLNRTVMSIIMLEKLGDHQYDNLKKDYDSLMSFLREENLIKQHPFSYRDVYWDMMKLDSPAAGQLLFHSVELESELLRFNSILGSSVKIIQNKFDYISSEIQRIRIIALRSSLILSFSLLGITFSLSLFFTGRIARDTGRIIDVLNSVDQFEDNVQFGVDRKDEIGELSDHLVLVFNRLAITGRSLIQSEKMASLSNLLMGFSHEINTPLGICVTSISALRSDMEEIRSSDTDIQRLYEAANLLDRSINRIVKLVNSFRDISPQAVDEISQVDLLNYLKKFIKSYTILCKQKNMDIEITGESINCLVDLTALRDILLQLLDNSIKHGYDDGSFRIVISLLSKDEWVSLSFADNGRGIDGASNDFIFDPFYTTTRSQGSIGLGLYRVHNLVREKLKGKITFESASGEGTSFHIEFPHRT